MVGGEHHKVKCKWCHKIMSDGTHRFKQHRAHISGDAKGCPNVPTEVRNAMRDIVQGKESDFAMGQFGGQVHLMPMGQFGYGCLDPSNYRQGPHGGGQGFFDFNITQYYHQNQNDNDDKEGIQPARHSTRY